MRGNGEGGAFLTKGETRCGSTRGCDRGQATVEFALVLPLLVLVLAGVVWVGNIMLTQVRLEHAAREGARVAAVEPARASSVATAAVGRTMPSASTNIGFDGDYVVVTVTKTVDGVPFIGVGARTLEADAVMRREDILN